MNRGLTSASLTELSGSAVEGYNLIRMDFAGFPLYVTDCPHEKTHDGNVYTPAAYISKFPAVKESLSIKANGISLGMSGVGLDTHTLSLMKHKGVDVYIYKWIEGVTSQVVPTFIGFIDSYISNENHAAGSAEIVWKITNHFANWDVVNGRKISDEGQKVMHPADDGFKLVGVTDPVTSLWGDKPFLDFSHYTPPVFRKSSFWNQQYFDIW